MNVVACAAPAGPIEPAPITSLPLDGIVGNRQVSAFWAADEAYYLLAQPQAGAFEDAQWFRVEAGDEGKSDENMDERVAIATLMSTIFPIGGGRVAFPVGSTGRRFYRVWRTSGSAAKTRTRILEVRAGRSRRLPA